MGHKNCPNKRSINISGMSRQAALMGQEHMLSYPISLSPVKLSIGLPEGQAGWGKDPNYLRQPIPNSKYVCIIYFIALYEVYNIVLLYIHIYESTVAQDRRLREYSQISFPAVLLCRE